MILFSHFDRKQPLCKGEDLKSALSSVKQKSWEPHQSLQSTAEADNKDPLLAF